MGSSGVSFFFWHIPDCLNNFYCIRNKCKPILGKVEHLIHLKQEKACECLKVHFWKTPCPAFEGPIMKVYKREIYAISWISADFNVERLILTEVHCWSSLYSTHCRRHQNVSTRWKLSQTTSIRTLIPAPPFFFFYTLSAFFLLCAIFSPSQSLFFSSFLLVTLKELL